MNICRGVLGDLIRIIFERFGLFLRVGVELEFYVTGDLDFSGICEALNCEIVPESGERQYEVRTKVYLMDLLQLSKDIADIKLAICRVAEYNGFTTLFQAKPFQEKVGSAMHINVSAVNTSGYNAFRRAEGLQYSSELLYSVGGLCNVMKEHMLYFAPSENCYLRYATPDIHTPTTISWGVHNRSVAIRLVKMGDAGFRVEHRVASSFCDSESAISAVVYGILYGLINRIMPFKEVYGIASHEQYDMEKLPSNLAEAYEFFRAIDLKSIT